MMSFSKVWHRFGVKAKGGSVWKLRIQDLPPTKLSDAVDLLVNFFARDEPFHRAAGISKNPKAIETCKMIYGLRIRDPSTRIVMCCFDNNMPEVKTVTGLSAMNLKKHHTSLIEKTSLQLSSAMVKNEEALQENKKLAKLVNGFMTMYDPVKEFNLDVYYEDIFAVVDPRFRGLGILENFLKVRQLMCKAHGIPMTGAWMTAFGAQIAGDRAGWETVKEIEYDYLAKKYDVSFTNVPRTLKYMIGKADSTGSMK